MKQNILSYIHKYNGHITYDTLTSINFDLRIDTILDELTEDLLQAELPNNCLLDIGWYPEFNSKGNFAVQVIMDMDWEKPLFKENCYTLEQLYTVVKKGLSCYKLKSTL
ncbi:MAG: hypothetical protein ACRCVU_17850 [Flavobacterium sp.]